MGSEESKPSADSQKKDRQKQLLLSRKRLKSKNWQRNYRCRKHQTILKRILTHLKTSKKSFKQKSS